MKVRKGASKTTREIDDKKTRLKTSLSPLRHFTKHLVSVFGKLPRENDLDHKSSRLSIRWLNGTPGESPATILTKTNKKFTPNLTPFERQGKELEHSFHSFHTASLSWMLEEAVDQEQAPKNNSKIKQQQIHLTTGALTHRDEASRLDVRNKTGRLDSKAQRAHKEIRRRELLLLTARRPAVVIDCVKTEN
jgi:hypothetical protein